MTLPELLKAARKQQRLEFDRKHPLERGSRTKLTIVLDPPPWKGDSAVQMLCASIRDGVHLMDLLNTFLPPKQQRAVWRPGGLSEAVSVVTDTVAVADSAIQGTLKVATDVTDQATKATMEVAKHVNAEAAAVTERAISGSAHMLADAGAISVAEKTQDSIEAKTIKKNLDAFCAALKDDELPFKLQQSVVFTPDDLLYYNRGTAHDQMERQKRVVKCLLNLATEVGRMTDYMGPVRNSIWHARTHERTHEHAITKLIRMSLSMLGGRRDLS
jgi:hypothetical protein